MTVLALLAAPFAAAADTGAAAPEVREEEDRIVLGNGHVTVSFVDKKPVLEVSDAGDANRTFTYGFARVVEYAPAEDAADPSAGDVVAFLDLADADDWQVDVTENASGATVTFTRVAPVTYPGPVDGLDVEMPTAEANVSLTFHLPADAGTEDAFTDVTPATVRQAFHVHAWPWADAENHRLALEVTTPHALDRGDEADARGVTFHDARDNATRVGALAWASTAAGTSGNGTADVPVEAFVNATDGNGTRLHLAYDAAGVPSFSHAQATTLAGVDEDDAAFGDVRDRLREVPGASALLVLGVAALAALGAAAVAVMFRRRH